jgi:hypothetical protein
MGGGYAQDLLDARFTTERAGQEGGTEWIVISTGVFMSFSFEDFWVVVDLPAPYDGGEKNGEVTIMLWVLIKLCSSHSTR